MQEKQVFSQFHHEPNPDYNFHDLFTYSGDDSELNPDAGIVFGYFDSVKHGWWLSKRDLSTPEEQEITLTVPYKQGEWDFSTLDGERFYKQRTLKYEFYIVDDDPQFRAGELQSAKRELFYPNNSKATDKVYDTGYPSYYFDGKCKSVTHSDDDEKGVMTVTVEFSVYPYAYARSLEGSDIWDEIDFDHFADNTTTIINKSDSPEAAYGSQISIYNFDKPQLITLHCTSNKGPLKVRGTNNTNYKVSDDNNNVNLIIEHGENNFMVYNAGRVTFQYRREVMI